jgi:uncharacterized Ntn-hydrolase superfamily protein
MTFSIVARSADGQSWGVAVASKFLAVGSAVPAAVAGVGAVATQAETNVAYKGLALSHMDEGATAPVALQRLLEEDPGREHRQVGIVDVDGTTASHTGQQCLDWAGGIAEQDITVQGNLLTGPEVVEAIKGAWDAGPAGLDLGRRLLAALTAGDRAGGDRRGRQSAALLVVRDGAGYGGLDDVAIDLRVDDHPDPCRELGRLLDLNELHLTASRDDEKVPVDSSLKQELETRARALGHPDFHSWVGSENYEMRVSGMGTGEDWIDQRILAIVREQSGGGQ